MEGEVTGTWDVLEGVRLALFDIDGTLCMHDRRALWNGNAIEWAEMLEGLRAMSDLEQLER